MPCFDSVVRTQYRPYWSIVENIHDFRRSESERAACICLYVQKRPELEYKDISCTSGRLQTNLSVCTDARIRTYRLKKVKKVTYDVNNKCSLKTFVYKHEVHNSSGIPRWDLNPRHPDDNSVPMLWPLSYRGKLLWGHEFAQVNKHVKNHQNPGAFDMIERVITATWRSNKNEAHKICRNWFSMTLTVIWTML